MRGSEGRKSPSGVQGQLPGGSLGAKHPEADDILKLMHKYVRLLRRETTFAAQKAPAENDFIAF